MRRGRGFATEVVGDPWFDRLNASLRRASAIAQRLLRELPVDEHRVAAILHPKI